MLLFFTVEQGQGMKERNQARRRLVDDARTHKRKYARIRSDELTCHTIRRVVRYATLKLIYAVS